MAIASVGAIFRALLVVGSQTNWLDYKFMMPVYPFMMKHFPLTRSAIRDHRYCVLFTSMFGHASEKAFLSNTLGTWMIMQLCSKYLDVWQVVALYFTGGAVGNLATVTASALLHKFRYQMKAFGASGGLWALMAFFWMAREPYPGNAILSNAFIDLGCCYFFLYEVLRTCVLLRCGYRGKGWFSIKSGHIAHLGGAVTGLAAYRVMGRSKVAQLQSSDDQEVVSEDDALRG